MKRKHRLRLRQVAKQSSPSDIRQMMAEIQRDPAAAKERLMELREQRRAEQFRATMEMLRETKKDAS